MTFDFVCVCSCEVVVIRPTISLDGPDLTDLRLILSLAGFVWASGENRLVLVTEMLAFVYINTTTHPF